MGGAPVVMATDRTPSRELGYDRRFLAGDGVGRRLDIFTDTPTYTGIYIFMCARRHTHTNA